MTNSRSNSKHTGSVFTGFTDVADLLLANGASLEVCNSLGRNCFHVISEAGEVSSLNFLTKHLEENFTNFINQTDAKGSTCLHLAVKVIYAYHQYLSNNFLSHV